MIGHDVVPGGGLDSSDQGPVSGMPTAFAIPFKENEAMVAGSATGGSGSSTALRLAIASLLTPAAADKPPLAVFATDKFPPAVFAADEPQPTRFAAGTSTAPVKLKTRVLPAAPGPSGGKVDVSEVQRRARLTAMNVQPRNESKGGASMKRPLATNLSSVNPAPFDLPACNAVVAGAAGLRFFAKTEMDAYIKKWAVTIKGRAGQTKVQDWLIPGGLTDGDRRELRIPHPPPPGGQFSKSDLSFLRQCFNSKRPKAGDKQKYPAA